MAVQKSITPGKKTVTAEKKTIVPEKKIIKPETKVLPIQSTELFAKDNYVWMAIGAAVVALGFILLSGGKNPDPNTFDYKIVYSTTRITIAPILIVAGLLVEIYAIFKKPKQSLA